MHTPQFCLPPPHVLPYHTNPPRPLRTNCIPSRWPFLLSFLQFILRPCDEIPLATSLSHPSPPIFCSHIDALPILLPYTSFHMLLSSPPSFPGTLKPSPLSSEISPGLCKALSSHDCFSQAQYVLFFYTRSHLSALQSCALIFLNQFLVYFHI